MIKQTKKMYLVFYDIDSDEIEGHTGDPIKDFKNNKYMGPFLTVKDAEEATRDRSYEDMGVHITVLVEEEVLQYFKNK